jgi:hypothetical protein
MCDNNNFNEYIDIDALTYSGNVNNVSTSDQQPMSDDNITFPDDNRQQRDEVR